MVFYLAEGTAKGNQGADHREYRLGEGDKDVNDSRELVLTEVHVGDGFRRLATLPMSYEIPKTHKIVRWRQATRFYKYCGEIRSRID
jgi:hypothetical protein